MQKRVRMLLSGFGGSLLLSGGAGAEQPVWLDFITDNDPGEHVYTAGEQTQIRNRIAADYSSFDFSFSLTAPSSGAYSTLTFNADGVVGGIAAGVDFRNRNPSDNALINIGALLGGPGEPAATSANFVGFTSTVGAHELGHLVGLRHGDSMGPIGSGISTFPGSGAFAPAYPGPTGADETDRHIMATPAAVGSTLADAVSDTFFSERSAVKLAFNENGSVLAEQAAAHGTLPTAQTIALSPLTVPNTLLSGDNFGKTFSVAAAVVTGEISAGSEADFYEFSGTAGDLMNMEVVSDLIATITNPIDSEIRVFDAAGDLVPYYTSTAFNNDELENTDSILIDLLLPETGDYFVKVNALGAADTGDYELFAYRFSAGSPVPEPSAIALMAAGLLVVGYALSSQRFSRR